METIIINNKKYDEKELNNEAKEQLNGIKFSENEIKYYQNIKTVTNKAKESYNTLLLERLPEKEAPKNRKKDIVIIGDKRYFINEMEKSTQDIIVTIHMIEKKLKNIDMELAVLTTAKNSYIESFEKLLK